LDQYSSELGSFVEEVVRPLERDSAHTQLLERFGSAHRNREAEASQGARAPRKSPENREGDAATYRRYPVVAAPAAAGCLVLTAQNRAVRRACLRKLGELSVGRRTFIPQLQPESGGPQVLREKPGVVKIHALGETKLVARTHDAHAQRREVAHECVDFGRRDAKRPGDSLPGGDPI